ncbi:MAG: hypothetical protein GEV06_27435 [Luteitalea sp.]|nr:hypothetical protein [Luteitalea sp.]
MIRVGFRLICSTNLAPSKAIAKGKLREDLCFRINTMAPGIHLSCHEFRAAVGVQPTGLRGGPPLKRQGLIADG